MGVEGGIVAGWICMTISGIFLAVQSGVNLTLGAHIGKSLAAVVSFGTGLMVLLVYFIIDTQAIGHPLPTKSGVAGAPWWSWIGGPLGAFYVASIILFAPRLGAANSLSVFIAAQLTTALVLDSKGWFGYKQKGFHWARALGLVFLIVGVVLVAKFEGKSPADSDTTDHGAPGLSPPLPRNSSDVSRAGASPAGTEASTPGSGVKKARALLVQIGALDP